MSLPVLVVGAGPTGLVLAIRLRTLGVPVRVVDTAAAPGTTSRALAVQARTVELYRQIGLADAVVARGHQVPAVALWVRGEQVASVSLAEMGAGLTPYPFALIFPQDEHERLLIARLAELGVEVERRTTLLGFDERGDRVDARLARADGGEELVRCAYLAGCDGAHSTVREVLGIEFPGGTYQQLFYVADVAASGAPVDGRLHVDLEEADFLAVFPLADAGRVRLVGTVRDERAERADTLRFEDVGQRAITNLRLQVRAVNWFSTYHVHHRVVERFRQGRAFLLGDAAHIHSPAGGQGMNTGIGDAMNLAWKLAAVLRGEARDALLDSYEAERIGFARRLVATTDRAFTFATADGRVADLVRTRLAPLVLPRVFYLERARDFLFRTVSQLALAYRDGPLSAGAAGAVHGGDRLPWVSEAGADNFASVDAGGWQAHVYGAPSPALSSWCAARGLTLHVFPWGAAAERAGLARNALYLVRPDGYVALADATGGAEALERYFAERPVGGSEP